MDCLQNVSELYKYISSVSLPVNKPVYASLFYVGLITLIFCRGGGVPDMPHSFGCEATDWL